MAKKRWGGRFRVEKKTIGGKQVSFFVQEYRAEPSGWDMENRWVYVSTRLDSLEEAIACADLLYQKRLDETITYEVVAE